MRIPIFPINFVISSLLLFFVTSAQAVPVPFASRAAFDLAFPGAVIEPWDSYAAGTVFADGSTTAGITYTTSTAGSALVTASFLTTTAPNGLGDTSAGFFGAGDSVTFGFSSPMVAFGLDINTFATSPGAYLATLDIGGVVGSVFDPFPGAGTGNFVGFSSATPFLAVTISGTGVATYTVDSLRAVSVPAPAGLAMFGLGLLLLGGWRRINR